MPSNSIFASMRSSLFVYHFQLSIPFFTIVENRWNSAYIVHDMLYAFDAKRILIVVLRSYQLSKCPQKKEYFWRMILTGHQKLTIISWLNTDSYSDPADVVSGYLETSVWLLADPHGLIASFFTCASVTLCYEDILDNDDILLFYRNSQKHVTCNFTLWVHTYGFKPFL